MADLTTLTGVSHYYGGDVALGPTGDLGRVNGLERSKQRVLRRLLTNPGDYIFHPTYGAGLGRYVGKVVDVAAIAVLIRGQMALERSVSQSPPPTIKASLIPNGIAVSVAYVALPDRQPVALAFEVTP